MALFTRRYADLVTCTEHTDCANYVPMGIECAHRTMVDSRPIGTAQIGRYSGERLAKDAEVIFTTVDRYENRWGQENRQEERKQTTHVELIVRSHVGRVVRTYSQVERVMSDVWDYVSYAVVANDDGTFSDIAIDSGSHSPRSLNEEWTTKADASSELLTAYERWVAAEAARKREEQRAEWARKEAEKEEQERRTPRKGKRVRVVRGRKVPIGTEGTVLWYGESKFGGYSVKIRTATDEVWVAAKNVEVVEAVDA